MKKKCTLKMVLYELRNLNGNLMPHFFGIIFPNLMCMLLPRAVASGLPADIQQKVTDSIMLSMAIVIPMSIMFLGYGAVYAQEVERGIPLRMRLFGFEEKSAIMAKVFAHLILLTIAVVIFAVFQMAVTKVSACSFFLFMPCNIIIFDRGYFTGHIPCACQPLQKIQHCLWSGNGNLLFNDYLMRNDGDKDKRTAECDAKNCSCLSHDVYRQ